MMGTELIMRFGDEWPEMGLPVWVWINGRWTIAALTKGMYPLHDERGKMQWSLLNAEERRAHDDDLYVVAEPPGVLPPPGSHGDAA